MGTPNVVPYGGAVTMSYIAQRIQDRLEEPSGPGIFWNLGDEIYPFLVEAMNEATLITGEPQVRATSVTTIPVSTVFTPLAMPSDGIAMLRIEGPNGPLKKCWIWDLDKQYPGWEIQTGDSPRYWFPFGLTQYGIYPCLTEPAEVIQSYVATPVTAARPYTGKELVPFQLEFLEGIEDSAAHAARLKEGGADFDQSMPEYQNFLNIMRELSAFAWRKDSLRFTRAVGTQSAIGDVRKR